MRILVISDSHGDSGGIRGILDAQPDAAVVLFCGDGEEDVAPMGERYPEKAFYMVRGNGDWGSHLPLMQVLTIEGVKIMFAHGHTYGVKGGDEDILFAARSAGAQMVCYGHTHIPKTEYQDGLHIVNPGSLRGSMGSYAVVDITAAGIVPFVVFRKGVKSPKF